MNETWSVKAKRWAPLAGTAVLLASVLLRFFGFEQGAAMVESVGGAVGLTQDSAVGSMELAAAVAALAGVVLKVRSQVKKASEARDSVGPR